MDENKELLIATGKALFGERWQSDMARALGYADARSVRQWLADERPMPASVLPRLEDLLVDRQVEIEETLARFRSR